MLTSTSRIKSDTITKVALHILKTSIPLCPFITIAVLHLKWVAWCARCNAATYQRNVKVLHFHTILWNDRRWYFWAEKQSMQQFGEKKTSDRVKEKVKCIIKSRIQDCQGCFLLPTTFGLCHSDWTKTPTEVKYDFFARTQPGFERILMRSLVGLVE